MSRSNAFWLVVCVVLSIAIAGMMGYRAGYEELNAESAIQRGRLAALVAEDAAAKEGQIAELRAKIRRALEDAQALDEERQLRDGKRADEALEWIGQVEKRLASIDKSLKEQKGCCCGLACECKKCDCKACRCKDCTGKEKVPIRPVPEVVVPPKRLLQRQCDK